MQNHIIHFTGFVIFTKTVNNRGTGRIQANHLNHATLLAQLEHHFIQCSDGSDIPKVRVLHINDNTGDVFTKIKGLYKRMTLGKKYLSGYDISAALPCFIQLTTHRHKMTNIIGEKY